MKRKIIKQSDSYTITLPIKWIREHGIDETKEVDLEEEREELIIKTKTTPRKEGELTIDSTNDKFIQYLLNNAYRNGYDLLKINFQKANIAKSIEKQLDLLMGWQITEKTDKKIIIESLTEPRYDKFDVLMRRTFFIIKNDLVLIRDFLEGKEQNLEEIKKNAAEAIRIDNFCRRCIFRKVVEKEKTHFYWHFIATITWIHRSIYYLSLELKKNLEDNKAAELINRIINSFNNLYEGFFEKNLNKIAVVFDITKEIQQNKSKIFKSGKNDLVNYHLIEISRLINLSCSDAIGINT
ncbi:AbrB/MazE/SpoVT family DNA-binding domain-containing protein [Candidatus Woesearchaeota archaeon]|nr:AbrB/MazE/SpoVT family DNA-binding domain-containing protein [Candidatus Woesearchaeota archaeon]